MTITLSQLQEEKPAYVDVPCPGIEDTFRLHMLELDDFLKLKPMFIGLQESGKVDAEGNADDSDLSDAFIPFILKSLGGDFDSPDGLAYFKRRPDLVMVLMNELTALHYDMITTMKPDGSPKQSVPEQVKND